jgi:hypothetical protein
MIEREIGYRGSKSITGLNNPRTINKSVIVKEQRVDGSYTKLLVLRCTLTGSEKNFQIKIRSKMHNSQFNLVRDYSTNPCTSDVENIILNP